MRKFSALFVVIVSFAFVTVAVAEEGPVNVGGIVKASYTGATKVKDDMFKLDLARFEFTGKVVEKMKYTLQFDLPTMTAGVPYVKEAWAELQATDMLAVGIGQIKKPFGREWLEPTATLDFWTLGVVASAFGKYDLGVWATAKPIETLSVVVALLNGTDLNTASDDQWPAVAVRVVADPMEMLSVGLSGYWNRQDQLAQAQNHMQFGADVQVKKGAAKATLEGGLEWNKAGAANVQAPAGAGEKSYYVDLAGTYGLMDGKVVVGARYSLAKPNYDIKGEVHGLAAQGWYCWSKAVKAGVDMSYTLKRGVGGGANTVDKQFAYRAGLQAAF